MAVTEKTQATMQATSPQHEGKRQATSRLHGHPPKLHSEGIDYPSDRASDQLKALE